MKNRWLINIILLLIVLSISLFLFLKPTQTKQTKQFEVSTFSLGDFDVVKIDFPSRASVVFKKNKKYMTILLILKTKEFVFLII